jgi:hypothetical protein
MCLYGEWSSPWTLQLLIDHSPMDDDADADALRDAD